MPLHELFDDVLLYSVEKMGPGDPSVEEQMSV